MVSVLVRCAISDGVAKFPRWSSKLTQQLGEDGAARKSEKTCTGVSVRRCSSSEAQVPLIGDDNSGNPSSVSSFTPDAPRGCWNGVEDHIAAPRRTAHRYFLLCLICLFIPGPYFHDAMLGCYKGPISEEMKLSSEQFELLFALSSLTGIVCGPSGAWIVQFGRTRSAIIAGLACSMGSLFTVLGYLWETLAFMLVARFVFWVALYLLMVVQNLLVYGMFEGSQLAFAYSFIVTACRLGSVFSYFLSGPLLEHFNVRGSLQVSVIVVFVSFAAILGFACLSRGSDTAQRVRPFPSGARSNAKKFSIALLQEVPGSVFAMTWSLGLLYGIIFPFEVVADEMLQEDFGYSADIAGFILTAIPAVSVFSPMVAPLLGSTIRDISVSCVVGHSALAIAQLLLYTQYPWTPVVSFGVIGIAYSITCCGLWTLLPMIVSSTVPPENVKCVEGLATGLCYAAIAICQFCANIFIGVIKDFASYRWVCMYFFLCAMCGALSAFAVAVWHRPSVSDVAATSTCLTPKRAGPEADEGHIAVCGTANVETSCAIDENYHRF